jgi:hypothetical protein
MKIRINTQFILDLSTSSFFALITMKVLTFIIPPGITRVFLVKGFEVVSLVFIALSIIFLISWFFNKNFKFKKKINFPELKDFLLLALPMSPVINYILINPEYLTLGTSLYLIGITLTFALFFSFILPIIFSYFASFNILMISGLALSFTLLSMPKIYFGHYLLKSLFITQGVYLIVSFAVVYLFYLFKKKLVYTIVIIFMITEIVQISLNYELYNSKSNVSKKVAQKVQNSDRLKKFLNNKDNKIIKKKNIYILVYESYVNLETHNYYGFDNNEQVEFLEKLGFKVHHGIYSNASASASTTSKIWMIDGEFYPPHDGPKTHWFNPYMSGNTFAGEIFKSNGYKTISLKTHGAWWAPPMGWDEYQPFQITKDSSGKILSKILFEGYFRHDAFNKQFDYNDYLTAKKGYLTSSEKNTLFFTHNNYPGHSGHSARCNIDDKKIYFEGMKKANTEMKDDVLNILNNDPNSIIVLVGDHGPYLTKNCSGLQDYYNASEINKYDIQDRYGTFLSIYWPKDISDVEHNIVMAQDIFPAILSKITNNNNLFNELKVDRKFFWDWEINWSVGGINVIDGIIKGGKDDGQPLFDKRTYNLPN